MLVYAYALGIKHGKQLSNGIIPKIENPVKTVVKAVEQHKAEKEATKLSDELNAMLNVTKESMLETVKRRGD
jgi:hypothetical protein